MQGMTPGRDGNPQPGVDPEDEVVAVGSWLQIPGTLPPHLAEDDHQDFARESLSYGGSDLPPELAVVIPFGRCGHRAFSFLLLEPDASM